MRIFTGFSLQCPVRDLISTGIISRGFRPQSDSNPAAGARCDELKVRAFVFDFPLIALPTIRFSQPPEQIGSTAAFWSVSSMEEVDRGY